MSNQRWPRTWTELAASGPWTVEENDDRIRLVLTVDANGSENDDSPAEYRIELFGRTARPAQMQTYLLTGDGDYLDSYVGLPEASACRQAAIWAKNLTTGRGWWRAPTVTDP